MRVIFVALTALALSACASLSDRAAAGLNSPGLDGVHWGLVVMTLEGRELVSINPDDRFLPASNTKLFTVAAAFHRLGDMTRSDPDFGTSIRLITGEGQPPSLFLVGAGDPSLVDAPDCKQDCLSDLANAVLLNGVREVETIIADETLYPREPWPPGWNQDDMITRSGAPVSALTVNSNELTLIVRPGEEVGAPGEITYREDPELYDINNHVDTIAADSPLETSIVAERFLDEPDDIRVYGRIKSGAAPIPLHVSVHDTAWAAGMRLKLLLEARGVAVTDGIEARYRPLKLFDDTATEFTSPRPGIEIARLLPPPLMEDVIFLMKQSQNLHAQLLLHRIGLVKGDGSREAGLRQVDDMLIEAGVPRWSWDFYDGSGMSTYNRVTPRTVMQLLRWTTQKPWSDAFRATLPIGGVDGTLRNRFIGTSLEGRIFAKTGTLMGTNALSGFMTTRGGKTLIFSAFANNRPSGAPPAIDALDATLVTIAEMN